MFLRSRAIENSKRLAICIAVYVGVVALVYSNGTRHAIDAQFLVRVLHFGHGLTLSNEVVPIHLVLPAENEATEAAALARRCGYRDSNATALAARCRVREVIDALAATKDPRDLPQRAVIDVDFTTHAGELIAPQVKTQSVRLRASILALKARRVDVDGGINPYSTVRNHEGQIDPGFIESSDRALYHVLTWTGATDFPYGFAGEEAYGYYDGSVGYELPNGLFKRLPALALVASDQVTDTNVMSTFSFPMGTSEAFASKLIAAQSGKPLAAPAALAGRTVVIGDDRADCSAIADRVEASRAGCAGNIRSGLELLTWAISARLAEGRAPYPHLSFVDDGTAIAATLMLSLVGVVTFIAVLRASRGRRAGVIAAAVSALALPLIIFGGYLLLQASGGVYVAQPSLECAGILAGDAAVFAYFRETIRERLFSLSVRTVNRDIRQIYDVFVSYDHDKANMRWVDEHLVTALQQARPASGRPLRIFIDRGELSVGDIWATKLRRALYGSRSIVPVYTDAYFDDELHPWCRRELDLGLQLQVEHRGFDVIPIARTLAIPEEYRFLQYVDAGAPDAIEQVIRRVLVSVSAADAVKELDHA